MRPARALAALLVLLAAYAILPGTGPWVRSLVVSAGQLYQYRHSSPDRRAESLLGEPWRLVTRAARETPADAAILIPSGPAYDPLSNRSWCAYYLYPRRLLRSEQLTGPVERQADFILVYRGAGLREAGVPPDSIRGDESGLIDLRGRRRPGGAPR